MGKLSPSAVGAGAMASPASALLVKRAVARYKGGLTPKTKVKAAGSSSLTFLILKFGNDLPKDCEPCEGSGIAYARARPPNPPPPPFPPPTHPFAKHEEQNYSCAATNTSNLLAFSSAMSEATSKSCDERPGLPHGTILGVTSDGVQVCPSLGGRSSARCASG
jgi:hypothetical protein